MHNEDHFEKYTEYEPYTDSIRDAEFDFWVRGLQRSEWSITHLDLAHIHIQFGVEGGGQISDGTTRHDGWNFFFQTRGQRMRANGQLLPSDSALLIAPGDQFYMSSVGPHNWYSVFIANGLLFESAQEISRMFGKNDSSRVVTLSAEQVAKVDRLGAAVSGADDQRSAIAQEELVSAARELLTLSGRFARKLGRRPEDRVKLLGEVALFIENSPMMNPTVTAIAKHCQVSERTLRNVLQEYFSVSPRTFVRLWRLHACRRRLRAGTTSTTTVQEIAAEYGFTDFGRFAEYYRTAFLEFPSETLNRS